MKAIVGLLALLGVLAMGFAGFCVVKDKPWEIDGGFLAVGAGLLVVALLVWVFHHRMEGKQEIEVPGGFKITINLGKLEKGESEIAAGKLRMVAEGKGERG